MMQTPEGGHVYYVCPKPCYRVGSCPFCDGGLAACTICGGLEGALLDTCPGVKLTEEQHDWNYRANMRRGRKAAEERRKAQCVGLPGKDWAELPTHQRKVNKHEHPR